MPKRLRALPAKLTQPEIEACFKKAKRAAGLRSALTDDQLRTVATIAWDRLWLFRGNANPDHDYTREDISNSVAVGIAWAVATDCAAFARALVAANKEAAKIEATPTWAFRRAYRNVRFVLQCKLAARSGFGTFTGAANINRLDVQTIREEAERRGCPGVSSASDKTIHKAIRDEQRWLESLPRRT